MPTKDPDKLQPEDCCWIQADDSLRKNWNCQTLFLSLHACAAQYLPLETPSGCTGLYLYKKTQSIVARIHP